MGFAHWRNARQKKLYAKDFQENRLRPAWDPQQGCIQSTRDCGLLTTEPLPDSFSLTWSKAKNIKLVSGPIKEPSFWTKSWVRSCKSPNNLGFLVVILFQPFQILVPWDGERGKLSQNAPAGLEHSNGHHVLEEFPGRMQTTPAPQKKQLIFASCSVGISEETEWCPHAQKSFMTKRFQTISRFCFQKEDYSVVTHTQRCGLIVVVGSVARRRRRCPGDAACCGGVRRTRTSRDDAGLWIRGGPPRLPHAAPASCSTSEALHTICSKTLEFPDSNQLLQETGNLSLKRPKLATRGWREVLSAMFLNFSEFECEHQWAKVMMRGDVTSHRTPMTTAKTAYFW